MSHTEIVRREVEAQPILFIRRKVAQTELQALFMECFPKIFGHAMQSGAAIAGNPMARYVSVGQGLWTVDAIVPLLKPGSGAGEIESGELQSGTVAFTVHNGPYEKLGEVYAAIERWMEEQGVKPNGPPWEWYVTDPGEHPDPLEWKTELYWPITQ